MKHTPALMGKQQQGSLGRCEETPQPKRRAAQVTLDGFRVLFMHDLAALSKNWCIYALIRGTLECIRRTTKDRTQSANNGFVTHGGG